MAEFSINSVGYIPGHESVRITVRAEDGPFAGRLHDIHTTQDALYARSPDKGTWGDAEVLAEATAALASSNATMRPISGGVLAVQP